MIAAASYSAASCLAAFDPNLHMTSKSLFTLQEALKILSDRTGALWTRDALLHAIIEHSLPLRATTPNGCREVIYSMGEEHDSGLPELGHRRHALLMTSAVRNLATHGEASSKMVALEPGDPGFQSWAEIKARRLVLDHANHSPQDWEALWPESKWVDGDYLGESSDVTLSESVSVNDQPCRVPDETIDELLLNSRLHALTPESSPADSPAPLNVTRHRLRRNSLDAPIEQAIKLAGSMALSDVWVQLRELALGGIAPFTGVLDGDKFMYTDDDNKLAYFSRVALKARLRRMQSRDENPAQ
jgi:hypothetical protein